MRRAVGDPADGAMLLFRCDSAEIPAAVVKLDPYLLHGMITRLQVHPWCGDVCKTGIN